MTAIRRPSRRLDTVPQRLLSMGLATATAVGLVGVLAVRSAEESAAAQTSDETSDSSAAEVISTDGLTQADLDNYAAQLDAERQRLEDYRDQLVVVANQLQQQADALSSGGRATTTVAPTKVRVRAPKAAPVPKAKAAPKASAPKAQAKSKSS